MIFELIKSAALLLALSYLQSLNSQKFPLSSFSGKLNSGLLFGIIAIIAMMTPIQLLPGLIFDPRSVIVSLVGLFYGFIPTLITWLMAVSYRAYIGGTGVYTGILVITICALLGLGYKHYQRYLPQLSHIVRLLLFGLTVHIAVLICFLTLPESVRWVVISTMALPFLTILPLASVFLGLLLQDVETKSKTQRRLINSETNYRDLFEKANVSIWLEDFSKIIPQIERLRSLEISDYHQFFKRHPNLVNQYLRQIRVVDANQASVKMYAAKDKDELLNSLEKTFVPESLEIFIDELVAICEKRPYFTAEALTQTLDGLPIHVLISISFPKPTEKWDKVIVSLTDISAQKRIEESLRINEHRHREIMATSVDGFWIVNHKGKLLEVNTAYIAMSGYSREELLEMSIPELEASESKDDVKAHIEKIIATGSDVFQTKHRRKNGIVWPVEVTVTYSTIEQGYFFVFLRDIYHRKMSEYLNTFKQQLAEQVLKGSIHQLINSTLESAEGVTGSPLGYFYLIDPEQNKPSQLIWSNHSLQLFPSLANPEDFPQLSISDSWKNCLLEGNTIIHKEGEIPSLPFFTASDTKKLKRSLCAPIFRHNKLVAAMGVLNKPVDYDKRDLEMVQNIADIAYDFIERRQADEHIEYLAYYDVLTGLPNRTLLFDRLNQAINLSKRTQNCFALCFLDLDGFKPINDHYGHAMGDKLLIEITARLKHVIREGDSLARLGGDEFIILLTTLSEPEDHTVVVSRILETISSPMIMDKIEIQLSASIGLTFYPQDKHDADTLLRHADQAMYKAKAAGKNRYYIHDFNYDIQLQENQRIIEQIIPALKNQEFILYYQPKVNINDGRIIGFEALIRWQHPQRGLLPPGVFLPPIENSAEELLLGEWVIETALKQLHKWQKSDINIPISVNVSAQQLQSSALPDYLDQLFKKYPLDLAKQLEFEILETTAIHDTAAVAKAMRHCARLGIKFSLDDFGTGYSSLTYFHRLPIDVLKIDQHFVRDMLNNPDDWRIVKGVINLADQYRRPVISEGVESLEIAFLLKQMGNIFMQGYAISRPIPSNQVIKWINDWKSNGIWNQLNQLIPDSTKDILVQVAILSVQHWVSEIVEIIKNGNTEKLTEFANESCSFSHWYNGLGKFNYGDHKTFASIGELHNQLHQIIDNEVKSPISNEAKAPLIKQLKFHQEQLICALEELNGQIISS